MVVLLPVADTGSRNKIARKCQRCREIRWRGEWESIHTNLCIPCVQDAARRKCVHCHGSVPVTRTDRHRKYCDAPECQAAKMNTLARRGLRARQEKLGATKVCPACAKPKPRTAEFWAVSKRDGSNVKQLDSYCRPCRAADMRARYETDEKRRRDARDRAKRQKARNRERMLADPVFADEMRRRKREYDRRYKWQRRAQALPAAGKPMGYSGVGPRLPVAPLWAAVERFMADRDMTKDATAALFGVSERALYRWEHESKSVRLEAADAALVGMDLLWWEVWSPDEYPKVAAIWEAD